MYLQSHPFCPPWAMTDRDARHSSHSNVVGPEDPTCLGAPWPFPTKGPIHGSAVIDYGGTAYVGSHDGWLYAVGHTGRGGPVYHAGSPIWVTPAFTSDPPDPRFGESGSLSARAIYFTTEAGQLHSVLPSGLPRWVVTPGLTQPQNSPLRSSPVVELGMGGLARIYAGSDNGNLYAVQETATGSAMTVWEASFPAPLRTSPALSPAGDVVYVGASDGSLHALDAATGKPASPPVRLASVPLTDPVVMPDGTVVVASQDGGVWAYTPTLSRRWRTALGGRILAAPALGLAGEVLVLAADTLVCLDGSGLPQWHEQFPGHRIVRAGPVVDAAGTVVVATDGGWVLGVRRNPVAGLRQDWAVQVEPSGPDLGSPTMDAYGRVFVTGLDGVLYVVDELPAFQLAFQSDRAAAGNIDLHSLRETYGVEDPARRIRVTDDAAADEQPAYSLDRSVLGFISQRSGSVDCYLATTLGTDPDDLTGTPPAGIQNDPAFTPVDDLTGEPRPPHTVAHIAVTTDASGDRRLIFVDLDALAVGPAVRHSFTDWAAGVGVPPATRSLLEPPGTNQSQAAFAPDGRKLAWRHCDVHGQIGEVRVLLFDSSGWRLTSVGPSFLPRPEQFTSPCLDEPCFAPDSRWIALRDRGNIAVYDVLGQLAPVFAPAPAPPAEPAHPAWSPDGTEIAFGLATASGTDLYVASEPGYRQYDRLTTTRTSDQPYFHYFKMPAPQIRGISPDRQVPDAAIEIYGRGFDIMRARNNLVFFTDVERGPLRQAKVLSAHVDPRMGLGVLTVRVPRHAGHGPITVETRYGAATTSTDFHVLPQPGRLVRARSVPGARIRVFGTGFDLSPATDNIISFTGAAGGWVTTKALGGAVDGDDEYLVVRVPAAGVAETGPIRVDNAFGGNTCAAAFTQLHPSLSLVRTVDTGPGTGLPQYALHGAAGVPVRVSGQNFPYDPFFDQGTTLAQVDAVAVIAPGTAPVPIRSLPFITTGIDTAGFGPDVFSFPTLGSSHPGGPLIVRATDLITPSARGATPFRVPLTDIPIIFVPGTSGTSLDLAPGTPTPFAVSQPLDIHRFPWLCKTCLPGSGPWAPIVHPPRIIEYDPGNSRLTPPVHPPDPRGPRVWIGPEAASELITLQPLANLGNHYLDALSYNPAGTPVNPEIVPGTVLRDVFIVPPGASGSVAWGSMPVYEPVLHFLTTRNKSLDWNGRPLCTSGATGACVDETGAPATGANAVYLFNLDWRNDLPTEQARLATFVDAVLARPDVSVKKVVLVTHSYGGPVARAYYLTPANQAERKVDQTISFGGGFAGVVQPFDILERGSTWGFGIGFGGLSGGFAEWETKALAQNWPTAYFQQPNSESWFADHAPSAGVNRSFVRDHRPLGSGEVSTWAASMAWVAGRHNGTLVGNHTSFSGPPGALPVALGDFTGGTGDIYHHRIIGIGRMDTVAATVVMLLPSLSVVTPWGAPLLAEWVPTEHSWPVYGDGDSTIPYHGAIGLTDPRDDRVYVITGAVHGDLPNLPEVIGAPGGPSVPGLLQLLLEGRVCAQPQAPSPFLSQNQVTENTGGSVIKPFGVRARDAGEPVPDRWVLQTRGFAEVTVVDTMGRRVGPARDHDPSRAADRKIPGASYSPGQMVSSVLVPTTEPCTVTLTTTVANPVNVYLSLYNDIGRFGTYFFRRVPVPSSVSGVARLEFDPLRPGEPVFVTERSGSAAPVRTTATRLTGVACDVTQPPTTRLEIADGRVRVTSRPAVDECPVARTYVTTDGVTHTPYEGAFLVPPDAKVVMAYSEDVAGNLEYPGATRPVLGLSAAQVRIPPDGTAAIAVTNLDPLGVSGELDWHGHCDADWLVLEPSSGTTPATLLLRTADGHDRRGTTRVLIRTSRADAAVSERTLTVLVGEPGPQ